MWDFRNGTLILMGGNTHFNMLHRISIDSLVKGHLYFLKGPFLKETFRFNIENWNMGDNILFYKSNLFWTSEKTPYMTNLESLAFLATLHKG